MTATTAATILYFGVTGILMVGFPASHFHVKRHLQSISYSTFAQ
jgi:hypothetical protein